MQALDLSAGSRTVLAEHTFGTVDLFLFSAVSWHPHRIHFDADYARDVEGHPALLVHGPLQAVRLFQELAAALPDTMRLVGSTYRHTSPLYVNVPARFVVEVAEVGTDTTELTAWVERVDDETQTTVGSARLQRV